RHPPQPTLFPYTTLFRSSKRKQGRTRSLFTSAADNITEMHAGLGLAPEAGYPMPLPNAPVAQLDRVSASEAEGRWFESSRVRHLDRKSTRLNSSHVKISY